MAILTLGGADMPAPAVMTVATESSRLSIKRTLDGSGAVSRAGTHRVLTLQWQYLENAALSALLQAALADPVTSVTYPDPQTGQTRQMNACCTEHTAGLMRMRGDTPVWTQVRLTLTEV